MIINYLTWLKNLTGCSSEEVSLPQNVKTVNDLLDFLCQKNEKYKSAFTNKNVIYAELDGKVVSHQTLLSGHKQVSFFSPIVGG